MRAGLYTSKYDTSEHCRLLLSSFVRFRVEVEVKSLTFMIGNIHPYSSEFVSQHVAAAVQPEQQSAASKKSNKEKNEKQIQCVKKRKETENGKTPRSEQPVVKSVCGSLKMRLRVASAIIVHRWMHKLQVEGN